MTHNSSRIPEKNLPGPASPSSSAGKPAGRRQADTTSAPYISPSAWLRWFLQRITALILVFGLLFHTILMHFTEAKLISFTAVTQRIQDYLLLGIFYVIFLGATLFHGLNGLYEIIDDYAPGQRVKKLLAWIFWLSGLTAFTWGIWLLTWWTKQ